MTMPAAFQIGTLSRRTGVNIETIRYYERSGLLPNPARTAAGYRAYGPADAERLQFIRRARDLGFSVEEVRRLLGLADQKSRSCRAVHALAREHLTEVRAKIVDLRRMEKVLAGMVAECAQGTMPECPLLETLAEPRRSRLPEP
ncbi:MAG: helix-turn-helix domain-containing protein [Reyranella sp.]|uniref:MerR family transcriptional regulator n=1 Tax=Reyranella sp. TaxID=1929291 RepID=UPI001AC355CC|nr:helix-turn-helix domain-containing protein [Reyranella sp.]MBN9091359.1 helix-turn-helix domain-containing protein [Reyranella sp.]